MRALANRRARVLALAILLAAVLAGVYALGLLIPEEAIAGSYLQAGQAPSLSHPFGTDALGRDLLLRTLKGLSTSMTVGIAASLISAGIAVLVGIASAIGSRRVDAGINWGIDLTMGVPHTILVMLISFALGRGLKGLLVGIAATHWCSLARLIRAEVLQLRGQPYVAVSRKLGKSSAWILVHHLLPHLMPQLLVGLILLSGDLGVALVYITMILLLLFCAGLPLWWFGGGALAGAVALPFLWNRLQPYQQERILVGFNPELDPLDKGWQALMSRQCIENGGLLGVGLRTGGNYEDLAASHTDFIFATVCEKFGFVGGLLVIAVLAVMVWRILWIGRQASHDAGFYICMGVAAVLIAQSAENLGMCLALLPVVGLTLPFVSCGGSSVLASFILLGMVHSVAAHKPTRRVGE